jgi:hypothetical protein
MALLPPFVNQFGVGKDKFIMSSSDVAGFQWDVVLENYPGNSAATVAAELSRIQDSIADLQHRVGQQLGAKWLMR